MKITLQKVSKASVSVNGAVLGSIEQGYVLFLGVLEGDTADQAQWLAQKIANLRLFPGEDGKINDRNILEVQGGVLVISQFTLAGKVEKGNRPDYTAAAKPDHAKVLYEAFIEMMKQEGVKKVERGEFGARMKVEIVNEGPVTLLLEKS